MTKIKFRDIEGMGKEERNKKLSELKLELMKAQTTSEKQNGAKTKQIKKFIARILTAENKPKEAKK
ncbi:50S ribosomal protein L29 [Candidatus Pacearchaeota archaeon ex4484_71]|nr:MAG: 50S ribosomal protein L29 [Candidatus Pacearchaeota archaeon ex4484_71]